MAKARAICTCKSCGCEFEKTTIKRNSREANSWEEWAASYYDECTDCYKERKEREKQEANEKAAEFSRESGLAPLTGSDKQIAWANTIRMKFVEAVDEFRAVRLQQIESCGSDEKEFIDAAGKEIESLDRIMAYLEQHYTEARFWIDNRNDVESGHSIVPPLLKAIFRDMNADADFNAESTVAEGEPEPEEQAVILQPESATEEGVVTIECEKANGAECIRARYQKSDDFRYIVKTLDYYWSSESGAWSKKITETTGSASDRMAELANRLLVEGYTVKVPESIADDAKNGKYEPEHTRWVKRGTGDTFVICWSGRDQHEFHAAKKLPGAEWVTGVGMKVPVTSFREVAEFAEYNDYRFTAAASEQMGGMMESVRQVTPTAGAEHRKNPLADHALEDAHRIIPDLIDD